MPYSRLTQKIIIFEICLHHHFKKKGRNAQGEKEKVSGKIDLLLIFHSPEVLLQT